MQKEMEEFELVYEKEKEEEEMEEIDEKISYGKKEKKRIMIISRRKIHTQKDDEKREK